MKGRDGLLMEPGDLLDDPLGLLLLPHRQQPAGGLGCDGVEEEREENCEETLSVIIWYESRFTRDGDRDVKLSPVSDEVSHQGHQHLARGPEDVDQVAHQ